MKALAALAALTALCGCVTVASIHVDGQRGRTYVVPFGGVAIERAPGDAVAVKAVAIGLAHDCGAWTAGVLVCGQIVAEPSSNLAIFDGRVIGHFPRLNRRSSHVQADQIVLSAGGDR